MNGIISIYKPIGISSFDVVYKIRKIANTKKVGHTGTLDPEACGVLPICMGRATKLVDYIMCDFKVYNVHLKLGITTETYDREGKILSKSLVPDDEEVVKNVIYSFMGETSQIPPMYSALKINGKKLYELARAGIEVEREARKINIYDISIKKINLPDVFFSVKCSKGTYIRSLCYDIGNILGCGGTMWGLERSQSGIFTIENSFKLEDINSNNIAENMISIEDALANFERITFNLNYEKALLNGVTLRDKRIIDSIQNDKMYRVYIGDNRFIGIGNKNQNGFKIIKLLV